MQKLEAPDHHYLSFAIGWLELRNPREAEAELARLSPALAMHPDVLEVRWALAAMVANWPMGLEVAEQLVRADPNRATGWLHRAYALRRVPNGGLDAAWDALLPAVKNFPTEPTIPFNLACYACQRGQLDEARAWLLRARTVGDKLRIKEMALHDDDLKPIWPEVAGW